MVTRRFATQNVPLEWAYTSGLRYEDPFNDVVLDVICNDESGCEWRVPAYWAGDQEWRVRFAAPQPGIYRIRTWCSDQTNPDLHEQQSLIEVAPYSGDNPLYQHGPLRASRDGRHLEHADGKPFFWLGDTWWMSLCKRLHWPDEFQTLTADRVAKGFTVIQIVAGLYPDMPAFDERGYNEAGHPWEREYTRINPAYFDMADLRIQWLVRSGLTPCIVGCWGYHLPWLGIERMKQHWRYLIARWGAYPVVWCLAGEGAMPYYLATDKARAREDQMAGWTDMGLTLRQIDPYRRPVTIHPTDAGRNQVLDDTVLDYDMLQTGHGGYNSIANTLDKLQTALARQPHMPVVEGEVCYEGILEGSREEIQRIMFWSCMLLGAAGFTYGANGLWQLNREGEPYGPSPHGATWGDTPWSEAYRLPGSLQISLGRALLERYAWWRFQPHADWVEPSMSQDNLLGPLSAGISDQVRIIRLQQPIGPWTPAIHVTALEPGNVYRAFFFDPKTGREYPLGTVSGATRWRIPTPPIIQDWVIVLERE